MKIQSYINFNGNTEEAFKYYKSIFGGNFSELQRFKDMPGSDKMPKEALNQILHISLPIGDGVLMGSDAMGHPVTAANNFSITIQPDSEKEASRIFKALAKGGNIKRPFGEMKMEPEGSFWSSYFGVCTDKYDINWIVRYGS